MAGSGNESVISSSGEEEGSSESSESESEPEPDKASAPPPSFKKTQPTPNASADQSDSQSEQETNKTFKNSQLSESSLKPLASKPINDDQSKKSRSKNPTSRYSPPPIKQLTGKRPTAEDDGGDLKKIKKNTVVDADNGGEKKQLFQRLWSEDNEIELIQGMIDYVEERGKDPVADVNDFHEFVKKSLHVDVNDRQMLAKARRLKKKFENNVAKVENKGKVRSFSNPHEKKMYELSKNLWGNDRNKNVVMSSSTKKVKAKVNVTPKINKSHKSVDSGNRSAGFEVTANEVEPKVVQHVRSSHGLDHLGSMGLPITEEVIVNKGLELLLGPKKVEMEEKWKNLKVQELEHFLKKADILKEQAELVLNAISHSGARYGTF
ncbi:hypothetical protein E3N88_37227 [Mikania micrantha]|uniref:Glabrous enhancer-binding protein-like DBD domain-containing protein n=1 Tax=Mikania micrantha TaxID=192012 RepID=A0A5N6M657_9ASTR|nr:hypothetical protein E3N88_37227 [Mikania micrantha]